MTNHKHGMTQEGKRAARLRNTVRQKKRLSKLVNDKIGEVFLSTTQC